MEEIENKYMWCDCYLKDVTVKEDGVPFCSYCGYLMEFKFGN